METFVHMNPTKLIFGQGTLMKLKDELKPFGRKVLLVYGGGSIKRNGVYDGVKEQLTLAGREVFELGGVEPNPRLSTVHKGVDICKREGIDFVLAVGGGSVIDCAKAIVVGAVYDGDVWDIISKKLYAPGALPYGAVLTLAATGSEMNAASVITNWETKEKNGWYAHFNHPQFSILDPAFTYTVPLDQTINGIVDIMTHILEQYFHHTPNAPVQDAFCEALLRTVVRTAPKLAANLEDYDSRETILYAGTMALNGTLAMGTPGDWASHNIEHAVSAVYDIAHGAGLAVLYPCWMEHVLDDGVAKFKQLAVEVFGVDPSGKEDRETALAGIRALREFWTSIGAPSRLKDFGIGDERFEEMADKAMARGPFGTIKTLGREDVLAIYRLAV
ncbi:iron-containing alcohol dehydrogenase [Cohnella thailandensis]|uniref:Iron-containing alcohol dehydrogenase n=1 Tax=Cohnella thailandensis TaxID=557557 RepID=A0A841SWJ6_9BACL|nr:iron-containing alcohol dehydrogenase [Cohnella thailandensis]MBB6636294.1 iron-containing alcohol dehydrogenase [Cohnella thailandensis]MBP1973737.1 alcohol dehydrogenase YqhD (iron-dependent ADH family) [Cohnella thailandensis]